MNNTENNRLIAEFMGGQYKNEGYYFLDHPCAYIKDGSGAIIHEDDLFYSQRLDWIFPVLSEIRRLNKWDSKIWFEYEISHCHCGIFSNTGIIFKNNGSSVIDAIFTSIVQFIKWYNENK